MATSMKFFDFVPRNNTNHLRVIVDEDDDDIGCPSSPSSAGSSPASSPYPTSALRFSSYNNLTDDDDDDSATSPKAGEDKAGRGSSRTLFVVPELDDEQDQDRPLVRKGLSRHFSGKSQSFTSLANARCLQDLVKPQKKMPPPKNMRSCRSYAAGLDGANNGPHSPKGMIAKRPIRNSSRGMFQSTRPPMHAHHSSGNLAGQAMLYT